MNIVGKTVKHSVFGIGTVTEVKKDQINVKFDREEKRFQYPSVFGKFLVAVEDSVNTAIQKEIVAAKKKKAAAEQLAYEETARKQAELERLVQDQSMQTVSPKKKPSKSKKEPVSILRIPDKRSTFFVFQTNTFGRESQGGYIWSPVSSDTAGQSDWDPFLEVRAGDVIFHGCDAKILALSIAKTKCYESAQPEEKEVHRIDCDYTLLQNPVKTAAFREDILKYSPAEHSPFDKNGNGNTYHFYDLNRKLAKVFLNGMLHDNAYLCDLDFVKELIEE